MKRNFVLALLAALMATAAHPAAAGNVASPAGDANTQLFAGGGTNVSNGFFFPGTVVCLGSDCQGKQFPLMVPQGNNIQFVNLDVGAVANCHTIQSFKRNRRTGRPLFATNDCVFGPATAIMITSHLKPGVFEYQCTTHFGMRGILQIQQ